jgi:predicted Zn-dependent protease
MLERLESDFRDLCPRAGYASLRFVRDEHELVSVRQNIAEPVHRSEEAGVMVTVIARGGCGYAATSDLTRSGLARALAEATSWAERAAGRSVVDFSSVPMPHPVGEYHGPNRVPWSAWSLEEKFDRLQNESRRLKIDDRIVDWQASLWHARSEVLFLTSGGGRMHQTFHYLVPSMNATANEKSDTQTRSLGGLREHCRQGGLEILETIGFERAAPRIAAEALELLAAPNCPSGRLHILLAPDQMILQIHELIGHPLELDRILGDERNYAGTSFVTPDMFGTYRYGSELLNVTFDPTRPEEFASYGFDDDGLRAEKTFIIEKGILMRGLGGVTSQARCNVGGVANARASGFNRPPIDRMANLNLEPGTSSLAEMIAAIDRGIWMKTNRSWSIDDSRNKFQFGCEWAQLIEKGRPTTIVKNPNYRGISATFWRSLAMVGDGSTLACMGTPFCGKGEPNQAIRVGHASPACVFADVDVFGGV